MPSEKLTKSLLNRIKPGDTEYTIWDDDIPGFGLRVRPGGGMAWVIKYRVGNGRDAAQRKLTIGPVGDALPLKWRESGRRVNSRRSGLVKIRPAKRQ